MTQSINTEVCRLCGSRVRYRFTKEILGRHTVGFHECESCISLQTDQPFWLEDSYRDSRRVLDTTAVKRVLDMRLCLYFLLWSLRMENECSVLDWGGGDGLYCRLLRDIGVDAYTYDPYCTNQYACGFEAKDSERKFDVITAFEVYEHLSNPAEELEKIFLLEPKLHLATTVFYTGQGPNWRYLNELTGRHVFFYSSKAMKWLATKYEYQYQSFGGYLHVFLKEWKSSWRAPLTRYLLQHYESCLVKILFELIRKGDLSKSDASVVRKRVISGELWKG